MNNHRLDRHSILILLAVQVANSRHYFDAHLQRSDWDVLEVLQVIEQAVILHVLCDDPQSILFVVIAQELKNELMLLNSQDFVDLLKSSIKIRFEENTSAFSVL